MDTHGGKKKMKVNRDELHLYIVKATTSPSTQIITIRIRDETNNLMASQTIALTTTAWYIIPMNGTTHNWFNAAKPKRSMNVEFSMGTSVGNGNQVYPSIGTSLLEQPYVIVYVD